MALFKDEKKMPQSSDFVLIYVIAKKFFMSGTVHISKEHISMF